MDAAPLVRNIAVVQMAMPVAANGILLSMQYGTDTDCMVRAAFLTTAASLLTIPLVASAIL